MKNLFYKINIPKDEYEKEKKKINDLKNRNNNVFANYINSNRFKILDTLPPYVKEALIKQRGNYK